MRALNILRVALVSLILVGCPALNEFNTPKADDPNYHCKDDTGKPNARYQWCYPYDGSRDCCWPDTQCSTVAGSPVCSALPTPGQVGARMTMKRRPESP